MKTIVLLAGLLTALAGTAAVAAEGPYLGVSGGAVFYQDNGALYDVSGNVAKSFDTGYAVKLSGGYLFDNNLRLEGEAGYKNASIAAPTVVGTGGAIRPRDTDLTVKSILFNGFYDFKSSLPITPFVGIGIGALQGDLQTYTGGDSTDITFGYQASAGFSYSVTERLNLDLSYRFEGATRDFKFDIIELSYRTSNILAGIRYTFL